MTKFRLLIKLLIVAIFISSPSTLALPSLNSAPNDDVIAGIKALHRAPEKEMSASENQESVLNSSNMKIQRKHKQGGLNKG